MHEIQPPIENNAQLAGYRAGLAKLDAIVRGREADLLMYAKEPQKVNSARFTLRRVYAIRQGIIEAIQIYLEQHPDLT